MSLRRTKTHLVGAGLCALLLFVGACDDVQFRTGTRSAQPPVFQPRTMRSLVSEKGLETLYQVEHLQGARLEHTSEPTTEFGLDLSLGPIAQDVPVRTWTVTAEADKLDVRIETQHIAVTIPVRIDEQVGARICRYSVEADRMTLETEATLEESDNKPAIEPAGDPVATLSNPQVSLVGDCPPLEQAAVDDRYAVEQLFVDYLERAWAASGRRTVAISPLDTLGLAHEAVGLERVSSFENRRGQLHLASRVTASNGSSLSSDGFDVDLDMALNSQRASCAPALVPEAPSTLSADEVPLSELERVDADVGMTLAGSLILRLAETSTLAGFSCRGLEDLSLDGSGSNLAADDLMLEEIGLGELPIGPWLEPVISPRALPEIELDPANDIVELAWKQLSVDLYAEMQGVPTRIVQVTANVILSLRPVDRVDRIDLAINSVSVTDASLQSQWIYERPFDSNLVRWTERTLGEVLRDTFSLPLPMEPGAPLHLVDSQVRPNDLLLLFQFDRHL